MPSPADNASPRFGVLFDVDGTLCDTNYLHAVAWGRALREAGHDAPMVTLHRHIGMGSDRFTETILGSHSEAATKAHKEIYREMWPEVRALPGARDLLRAVREKGAAVVLASSADREELDDVLRKALDCDDVIDDATSSGDADTSKPSPDIFQAALEAGDLDAANAIVVGDTVWDVQAAKKAGMDCVAVLSGGIGADEFRDAGAIAIYDGPAHLLADLDNSPIADLQRRVG